MLQTILIFEFTPEVLENIHVCDILKDTLVPVVYKTLMLPQTETKVIAIASNPEKPRLDYHTGCIKSIITNNLWKKITDIYNILVTFDYVRATYTMDLYNDLR